MSLNALAIDGRPAAQPAKTKWRRWVSRVISAQPILALLASATLKLTHQPMMVARLSGLGYPESTVTVIGLLALGCAVVYAIPATSVLGAALMTAYFGGAVATHLRVSEPVGIPIVLGVLAWLGLYLRNGNLRPLLPLRATQS
jgi:hypothetical protein